MLTSLHRLTARPNRLICVYLHAVQLSLYSNRRSLLKKGSTVLLYVCVCLGRGGGECCFVFCCPEIYSYFRCVFSPHCCLCAHLYCLGDRSVTLHRVHCPCEKGPQPLQHVLQFCPLVAFPSRTLQGVMHGICSCTLTNAFPRVEATTTFLYPP